jgi:hypothetical protein
LCEGAKTLSATQTDVAGSNTSRTATHDITVDTVAPTITSVFYNTSSDTITLHGTELNAFPGVPSGSNLSCYFNDNSGQSRNFSRWRYKFFK